jgi:hypothetical protein
MVQPQEEVRVRRPTAANDIAISADQILLPNSQESISEFFKEIYKESLNSYRFYGSLRASIVWPPATLVSASAIYLLSNANIHLIPYGKYMIPLVFSVVLGLTGYINYHFQIMQAESMAVARKCLEHWKNGIDGKEMNPYTYSDLKAQINLKKRFDTPSLCLIVFSFIVLFLNVFISVYPATQRGTTMP